MKSIAGFAVQVSMKMTLVGAMAVLVGLLRAHRLANELTRGDAP